MQGLDDKKIGRVKGYVVQKREDSGKVDGTYDISTNIF